MRLMIISACCAIALPAAAQDTNTIYRCVASDGVPMLADRPCETLEMTPRPADATAPLPARAPAIEKEHFTLPPSETGRSRWSSKAPASVPPRIDVETLRLARQTLGLRDKVASAR